MKKECNEVSLEKFSDGFIEELEGIVKGSGDLRVLSEESKQELRELTGVEDGVVEGYLRIDLGQERVTRGIRLEK